ncbi:MAG: MATE family efflux transporter [Lachnospiraceae bacterium]|nr:MATE family efflux transporter [Lachnospiraceae bacterium]
MAGKSKNFEIDMCTGRLASKMLLFTLPLIASSLLQLLFNAADMVVAGRYAGDTALASISGTSSITNLIINLFLGLSVGANVIVAKYYGQNSEEDVSECVHTSVVISLLAGAFLAVFGFAVARPVLTLMQTPENVIDGAVLYMRIYFLGMPIIMLYNFTSAILRAVGDTRRPLIYLAIAGAINVVLNMIFVIVFHMGVAGVAIATVVSQAVSAALVMIALFRYDGCLKLSLSKMKIAGTKLLQMTKIGLPAGIQGSFFSISNVLIQSSINSFGSLAMSGNAAASNIEGFVYAGMNAFHHTALSFTSQNLGGGQYKRIKKVIYYGLLFVTTVGIGLSLVVYFFRYPFLGLYIGKTTLNRAQVIEYGVVRMKFIILTYFTCGTMDVIVGCLRGLGKSFTPMMLTLLFVCVFRVVWISTVFRIPQYHTLECVYISYPISWVMATIVQGAYLAYSYRKLKIEKGLIKGLRTLV